MVPLLRAAEKSSLAGKPAAIGAYNVNFFAQAMGVVRGCRDSDAPAVVQASKGANRFQGGPDKIQHMVLLALEKGRISVPIALHLDHGDDKSAFECVDRGFTSVMIDASKLPFEDNVAKTKSIVEYAHKKGVSVEGEYGILSGVEEDIHAQKAVYADPDRVPIFFEQTGADALAVAYGTSHGPNKGKTTALKVDIVQKSYANLKGKKMNLDHFLVSHGSSTVPQEFVSMINRYGGDLKGASGVPEDMIKKVIASGARKINIDTDLRLLMTGQVRKWLSEHPKSGSKHIEMIRDVFDGKTPAYEGDKVIPPSELKDPRSWLQPLMDADPTSLRDDYRLTKDALFIELMELIEDSVASHVAKLNRLFGSAGLAKSVEKCSVLLR
jgi:fructose-bisphosphate aldolase class II